MSEALQWSAAVIVLAAYALSLRGVWSVRSYRYLGFNLIGGFGLCAAAVISHQWGFVLLEGVVKDHGNSPGVITGIPHPPGGR